jgi:arsenate reductase (thioredoxin)
VKPTVLFVCVENSCRSQLAEGFAKKWGNGTIDAWSAGSKPSGRVNPTGIELMKEVGIDLSSHTSKGLTDLPALKWDYVITMGCGDACPFVPAKRTEDWGIPDPKHLSVEEFRKVRDLIEKKVRALIDEASH